jgi:hypothetical protein
VYDARRCGGDVCQVLKISLYKPTNVDIRWRSPYVPVDRPRQVVMVVVVEQPLLFGLLWEGGGGAPGDGVIIKRRRHRARRDEHLESAHFKGHVANLNTKIGDAGGKIHARDLIRLVRRKRVAQQAVSNDSGRCRKEDHVRLM